MTSLSTSLRKYWPLYLALILVRIIGFNYFNFNDDAYITLRYARNLVEGHGFVFNPGEWVLGITTPLWGLIGAALHYLPMQIEYSVSIVSLLAECCVLYLTLRHFDEREKPVAAIAFGLCYAASGVLTRIGVSGMESSLFLFAACLAIWQYQKGKEILAVIIATVAYFLRPEAVLLVGAIVLSPLLFKRKIKRTLLLAAISAAIVAPFLALLYHYYGTFIPQSVMAKSTVEPWTLWMVITGLILSDPLCFLLLPLTIYGAVRAWKSDAYGRMWVLWITPFALAYLISRPPVYRWYGEPVHYAEMLFSAYALQWVFAKRGARIKQVVQPRVMIGLCTLIVAGWGALLAVEGRNPVQQNMYYGFRDYFAEHPIKGDTLLCGDIGAVGYYSEAHIIDPYGLVTPDALAYDSIPADVWHYKPKYFMAYETHWQIGHFNYNPWMLKDYTLIHHFDAEAHPMDTIDLDETHYPKGISGFFLMRRRD